MRNRVSRIMPPVAATAILAALLFAGFGCKPILDAQQQQQAKVTKSTWIVDEPKATVTMDPDATGQIFVELRTPPNCAVTVSLNGPGVLEGVSQTRDVDAKGAVKFMWHVNRFGRYTYAGTVVFNHIVVDSFDGYQDVNR